jgi:hypothetical protein
VRPKLDAGLAVRREQEHRWRHRQVHPQRNPSLTTDHRLHRYGRNGIGWGTGVTLDKVWVTSFNGEIGVMDFDGRPIGKESDFPFKEKFIGLIGSPQTVTSGLPMDRTISCCISPADG